MDMHSASTTFYGCIFFLYQIDFLAQAWRVHTPLQAIDLGEE